MTASTKPEPLAHMYLDSIEPDTKAYTGIGTIYTVNDMQFVVVAPDHATLLRIHAILGVTSIYDESKTNEACVIPTRRTEEKL